MEDGGWERIRNQATRHEPAQTVVYATKSCVMCKRTKAQREITKVKSRSKKERKKERIASNRESRIMTVRDGVLQAPQANQGSSVRGLIQARDWRCR